MKKISLLFVCLFIGMLWVGESKAQGFTPPSMVFGFSLDGILATNDAHGSSLSSTHVINNGDYGMVWGRGASLTAKFGLGLRKNHRITVGAHYSKMVHDNTGELPFFNLKASAPYTNYDIFTGSAGYEYTFNARCKTKQSIGLALTTSYITGEKNAIYNFDNSFRMGFQVSVNYEWTLGKAQKM